MTDEKDASLRILCLDAENVKRLSAVHITPDPQGGLVIIGGANAQGKTSVLDSILYALGGERAIPPEPIRIGETKATITLDLGFPDGKVEYRVTRSITPKGSYLRIEAGDGSGLEARSPQKLLDRILGALTFDPLAFARMKPAEQREALLSAVGLTEEIAAIDATRKAAFEERTLATRDLRKAQGHLDSLPDPPQDRPSERQDIQQLITALDAAAEKVRECDNLDRRLVDAKNELERVGRDQAAIKSAAEAGVKAALDAVNAGGAAPDVAPLRERLDQADAANQVFDAAHEAVKALVDTKIECDKLQLEVAARARTIEKCDEQKQKLLEAAALPVEGLGCTEQGVTYEGLPFEQAASSLQLRVSAAVGMALNPTLRVMRIEDGSLLDTENLQALDAMARQGEFQIWIERVGSGDPGAVVIEDGTNAQPEDAQADGEAAGAEA